MATIKVRADLSTLLTTPEHSIPFRAANRKSLRDQSSGRIVFGYWGTDPSEEVVICRPSDQEFEIHCHGGLAAARRIMGDLAALQLSPLDWDIQSRQAAGNLTTDCQLALTKATTLQTASILLDQEAAWREFTESSVLAAIAGQWRELSAEIKHALSWQDLGKHLWEPFRVVLTGRPNVGKSALLNALVGYQRSVVFDQPGTTRDVVTVETAFEGWPVRLIDTAGLRDNALGLEAAGIELAYAQLADADLVLQVIDATELQDSRDVTAADGTKSIVVINKFDLVPANSQSDRPHSGAISVSAKTGFGIELLIAEIAAKLVPVCPDGGTLVPFLDDQIGWLHGLAEAVERQSLQEIRDICDQILR
ncbi:MAG: small GTP-binding protein [Planctomycetaceae bacterium]|nr:small GTP-binding protein [Planctomycetaceae bacterium]